MAIKEQFIEELFSAMHEGRRIHVPDLTDEKIDIHELPIKYRNLLQDADKLFPDSIPELPLDSGITPGSLQLLRALAVKGKRTDTDFIKALEKVCKGEPLIGMELYPDAQDSTEKFAVAAGAAALNLLRGQKTYGIEDSRYDGTKWNYRIMPACHPIFAMLIRELSTYMPQGRPIPYMLTIGTNMKSDSVILLAAWILSHPEISELAYTMVRGTGNVDFPGMYLGQRARSLSNYVTTVLLMPSPAIGNLIAGLYSDTAGLIGASIGVPFSAYAFWSTIRQTQTNLYAGIMHPELPDTEDFIHISGVLAGTYKRKKKYFNEFKHTFYNSLEEVGLTDLIRDIDAVKAYELRAIRNGRYSPNLAEAAMSLGIDRSEYIWARVQQSVAEIERILYRPEELDIINRAYSGQLLH